MRARLQLLAALLSVALLSGCSISITNPPNGSTVATLPQPLQYTESGVNGVPTISLDGNDLTDINGQTFQWGSGGLMFTIPPGSHSVTVSGQTGWNYNVSDTSNFTVAANACPLCYACPPGQFLHAFMGLCCTGNKCDMQGFSNFGLSLFSAPICSSSQSNDCMNQNLEGLCGGQGTGCSGLANMAIQMVAVSFSPQQSGALAEIQVPIGWRNGANAFQAWITSDNAGKPGTVLETFPLSNLRTLPFPDTTPVHIFSAAHPALTTGTNYWLVIGPTGATAVGSWNLSLGDSPAAGSSNFLVNVTGTNGVPSINGPWVPATAVLRPAFEIDVR
ncbi:MAG TPA: choice-of-anchor R domain-containing protein [Candidatus Acidoferrales bacterium]|nr:choice-of-anchor R domain-containing protein [Candidatus Acidoferrales bacterium]